MADEKKDEKKIIVDEDWKAQAQKEKETLAEQEQTEQQQQRGPLPKGDLAALISMLTTQILFALGVLHFEGQEPKEPDLELAKFNIDILAAIEEKTKGNLSEQEEKVLKNTLSEVRMAYVKMAG
ncbi:MAG: DUF1844 domain-containing protein [Phycisphaerae bacterium]